MTGDIQSEKLKWHTEMSKGGEGGKSGTAFSDIYEGTEYIEGGYGIYFDKADKIVAAHNAALDRAVAALREEIKTLHFTHAVELADREKSLAAAQADTKRLTEKFDDMLVAEVKRCGGIPSLSHEEMELREALAEFLDAAMNEKPK